MTSSAAAPELSGRWRAGQPPATAVTVQHHRGLWAIVPITVGPVMVALTFAWFADVLPDRVPISWSGSGEVTRTAAAWRVAWICAALGVVAVAVAASVVRGAARLGFRSQRLVVIGCAAFTGLVSGAWWTLIVAVLTAGAPVDVAGAPSPGARLSWLVVWVLVIAGTAGVLCGRPASVATTVLPDPRLPRVELPVDRPAPWQVSFCTGFFTFGGCLLALFGSTVFWTSAVVAVMAWACAVVSLLMGRMTLRIDERGITMAPWGLPVPVTLSFDELVEARPGVVRPLSWGSGAHKVINARTGMWPRTGPGVTLMLADGRTLGLALDSAEVAAGIINSHLDRARGGPYTGPLRRTADADATD